MQRSPPSPAWVGERSTRMEEERSPCRLALGGMILVHPIVVCTFIRPIETLVNGWSDPVCHRFCDAAAQRTHLDWLPMQFPANPVGWSLWRASSQLHRSIDSRPPDKNRTAQLAQAFHSNVAPHPSPTLCGKQA